MLLPIIWLGGAYCVHHRCHNFLMMEAGSTSETSVNMYRTIPRKISEDSHLHTRLAEMESYYVKRSNKFEGNSRSQQ